MNIRQFFKLRIPFLLFLVLYLLFTFKTYADYGMTVDEFFAYTRGVYFYTKVKGNDPELQKGFVVKERGNENLLYYNSTYTALLYVFNEDKTYERYHLLNMLVAVVAYYLLYEALLFFYKKPAYAIIGPLFLFFTPRFMGHVPANPKDIPYAISYTFALLSIFFTRASHSNIRILLVGLLIGVTASLRFVGFSLLIVYFALQCYEQCIIQKQKLSRFFYTALESVLVCIVSFLVFLVSMPYVAADPYNHLIELMRVNTIFPWQGSVYLFGQEYNETTIPLAYMPIWLIITTPVFLLVLMVRAFIVTSKIKVVQQFKNFIVFSILLQFSLYLALQPVVYNGLRHYLFLLPSVALLSAITFIEIIANKNTWRLLIVGVTVVSIGLTLWFYIFFHPYQYVFFNEFIGQARGKAYFELDYWGASDREALTWLRNHTNKESAKVYLCSKSHGRSYYYPESIDFHAYPEQADYIICNDYRMFNTLTEKIPGETVHEVKRAGLVITTIYKVKRSD